MEEKDIYFKFSSSITPSPTVTSDDKHDTQQAVWRSQKREADYVRKLYKNKEGPFSTFTEENLSNCSLGGSSGRSSVNVSTPITPVSHAVLINEKNELNILKKENIDTKLSKKGVHTQNHIDTNFPLHTQNTIHTHNPVDKQNAVHTHTSGDTQNALHTHNTVDTQNRAHTQNHVDTQGFLQTAQTNAHTCTPNGLDTITQNDVILTTQKGMHNRQEDVGTERSLDLTEKGVKIRKGVDTQNNLQAEESAHTQNDINSDDFLHTFSKIKTSVHTQDDMNSPTSNAHMNTYSNNIPQKEHFTINLKLPIHTKTSLGFEEGLIYSEWLCTHPWTSEILVEHEWLDNNYLNNIDNVLDGVDYVYDKEAFSRTTWDLWNDDGFFFDLDTAYVSCNGMYIHHLLSHNNNINDAESSKFFSNNNFEKGILQPFENFLENRSQHSFNCVRNSSPHRNKCSVFYSTPPHFPPDPGDLLNKITSPIKQQPLEEKVFQASSPPPITPSPPPTTPYSPSSEAMISGNKRRRLGESNLSDTRLQRFKQCITSNINKEEILPANDKKKEHEKVKEEVDEDDFVQKLNLREFITKERFTGSSKWGLNKELSKKKSEEELASTKGGKRGVDTCEITGKKGLEKNENESKLKDESSLFLPNFETFKDLLNSSLKPNPTIQGFSSPLSPDVEFFDFQARSGHTSFHWEKEIKPLGYIPPLCNCANEEYVSLYNQSTKSVNLSPTSSQLESSYYSNKPLSPLGNLSSSSVHTAQKKSSKQPIKISSRTSISQQSTPSINTIPLSQNSPSSTLSKLPSICPNNSCQGLLFIPYSFIEVPLNHEIDNIITFCKRILVPPETEVYCGNTRHTALVVTRTPEHEYLCWKALEMEAISDSCLIYDVDPNSFNPFYKPFHVTAGSQSTPTNPHMNDEIPSSSTGHTSTHTTTPLPYLTSSFRVDLPHTQNPPQAQSKRSSVTNTSDPLKGIPINSFAYHRRPLKLSLRKKPIQENTIPLFDQFNQNNTLSKESALMTLCETLSIASSDFSISDVSDIIEEEWKFIETNQLDALPVDSKLKLTEELLSTVENLLEQTAYVHTVHKLPTLTSPSNTPTNQNINNHINNISQKDPTAFTIEIPFAEESFDENEMEQIAFAYVNTQLTALKQAKNNNTTENQRSPSPLTNQPFALPIKTSPTTTQHKTTLLSSPIQSRSHTEIIPTHKRQHTSQNLLQQQSSNLHTSATSTSYIQKPQHTTHPPSQPHLSHPSLPPSNSSNISKPTHLLSMSSKLTSETKHNKINESVHTRDLNENNTFNIQMPLPHKQQYIPSSIEEQSSLLGHPPSINPLSLHTSNKTLKSTSINNPHDSISINRSSPPPHLQQQFSQSNFHDKSDSYYKQEEENYDTIMAVPSPEMDIQPIKSSLKSSQKATKVSYPSHPSRLSAPTLNTLITHQPPHSSASTSRKDTLLTSKQLPNSNLSNLSGINQTNNNPKKPTAKRRNFQPISNAANERLISLNEKRNLNQNASQPINLPHYEASEIISDLSNLVQPNNSRAHGSNVIKTLFTQEKMSFAQNSYIPTLCNALDKYFLSMKLKILCIRKRCFLNHNDKNGFFYITLSSQLPIEYDNFQITVDKFKWLFKLYYPTSPNHLSDNDDFSLDNKSRDKPKLTPNHSTKPEELMSKTKEPYNEENIPIPSYTRSNVQASATRRFPNSSSSNLLQK